MPGNPVVFLDFTLGKQPGGRVLIELFADVTPNTAENFRGLCTGEYGCSKKTRKPLHYAGCKVFKVVQGSCIVAGDFEKNNGEGGDSIYGGEFDDENFSRRHTHAGLVSMENHGRNTNTSQFMITLRKIPWMNGKHVVFGQVISGMEVIRAIEIIPRDTADAPRATVTIEDCGEVKGHVFKRFDAHEEARQLISHLMGTTQSQAKLTQLASVGDGSYDEQKNEIQSYSRGKKGTKKINAEPSAFSKGRQQLHDAAENARAALPNQPTESAKETIESGTSQNVGEVKLATPLQATCDSREDAHAGLEVRDIDILTADPKQKKLFELRMRMNEGRKLNNREVIQEKRRLADANYEKRYAKKMTSEDSHRNGKSLDSGEVEDTIQTVAGKEYLNDTLEYAEKRSEKDRKKKESFGWNVFNQDALYRSHRKRLKNITFHRDEYEKQKNELGSKFYDVESAAFAGFTFHPSEDAKERLVEMINTDEKKRTQFSRRRTFVEDEHVSYINERNRVFNKKLDRAFGDYSMEIKMNLERGTAL